jgi:hypothetical protein
VPGTTGRLCTAHGGGGEAHGRAGRSSPFPTQALGLAFTYGRRTPARSFPPPPYPAKASGHRGTGAVPSHNRMPLPVARTSSASNGLRLRGTVPVTGIAPGEYYRRTQRNGEGGWHRPIAPAPAGVLPVPGPAGFVFVRLSQARALRRHVSYKGSSGTGTVLFFLTKILASWYPENRHGED